MSRTGAFLSVLCLCPQVRRRDARQGSDFKSHLDVLQGQVFLLALLKDLVKLSQRTWILWSLDLLLVPAWI